MSPPNNEFESGLPPLSRRTLFAVAGVLAAATAVAADLGRPLEASAAVAWGHPFAYRAVPGSPFGMRDTGMHEGQDYPASTDTPIYAVADGTVTNRDWIGGYGNAVFISHAEGWSSRYAHMNAASALSPGQVVRRGDLVGYVGNTGNSYGPHLHIELRINGTAVNPIPYIQDAQLAGQEPQMTPEQAALLAQVAADVKWIKDRIGGTVSSPTLASEFNVVRSRIGGEGATPNISQDVSWLKARIGGSGSDTSITDRLRAIQGA
jgi:hypothetical protein